MLTCYRFVTRPATTGGFLRAGNTTLIIGTEDEKVGRAIEIIGNESKRRTEIVPSTAAYDIGRWSRNLCDWRSRILQIIIVIITII